MTDDFRRAAFIAASVEIESAKREVREGLAKKFEIVAAEMRARRMLESLKGQSIPDELMRKIRMHMTPRVVEMKKREGE